MNTTEIQDSIQKTKWFNQSIQRVWQAITENQEVSQWLVPTDFKAEVGSSYCLKDPKDNCNMVTGMVKEASPYTLIYSWINEAVKDVETTVRWDLVEENGGTTLTMTHSGISKYSDNVRTEMINSYTGGWERCFDNLNNMLG